MNLRNGKVLFQQQHQEQENINITITVIQENTIQHQPPNHHDKAIIKLVKDLLSVFGRLDLQNLTKEEIFNEKLRILSELYYLNKYYDLHSNPVFVKLNTAYKNKSHEFLYDINKFLHRSSGYNLSRRDRLHARNFAKELAAILK